MTEQHHFRIAEIAEEHHDYERVLWTGRHAQLVLLTIPGKGEVGEEIHEHGDQVVAVVSGKAEVTMNGGATHADPGDVVVIPRGTRHNLTNRGKDPLVVYTVYAPPEHAVDGAYPTREEAEQAQESGEDTPPPLGI